MTTPFTAERWQRLVERCCHTGSNTPEASSASDKQLNAGFLFSGISHQIVPRQLLLDNRLTPLERNAWQVLRMLTANGLATPRYEDLQPFLASTPCGGIASRETIARVMTMLRLTRWLTLVRRSRDRVDGRFNGNVYVLHEEPLSHRESLELDSGYLELMGNSLTHSTKAIRLVAKAMVHELLADDTLELPELPSRLVTWAERLIHSEELQKSERGEIYRVRNFSSPSTKSEPGLKAAPHHAVRNPNADSTVLGIKESTVLRGRAREEPLRWPPNLQLTPSERRACDQALSKLAIQERQAVLDEAHARCAAGTVRKPAAYLLGLVQRALTGEFKPWASTPSSSNAAPAPPEEHPTVASRARTTPPQAASPLAKSYLAELRAITGGAGAQESPSSELDR